MLGSNIVVLTCLCMLTLVLPAPLFEEWYFNPLRQGPFASTFPQGGYGPMQQRGDICRLIVPKDFWQLPADVRKVINLYFHHEEQEL